MIARRIRELFPDVKLIAMLRDPVERAISSYWQTAVLGDDERSLDDALDAELSAEALEAARARPTDGHQHIVAGEYGRILEAYLGRSRGSSCSSARRRSWAASRWCSCASSGGSSASTTRTSRPT